MRHYYDLVSGVDDACRVIVAELDEQGVLNRTIIIISADNGMMLGAHGLAGKWNP
jgi:arylsulfatase A-like enzyme